MPIDVDVAMLERVAAELTREFPGLSVHGIGADFDHSLDRLPPSDGSRLVAFLGSTIGNLRPADQAPALLRSIRAQMRSGDHFLLGVDLIKDRARLEAAYNDSRGVTAAFSRNILRTWSTDSPTPTSTPTPSATARSGTSRTPGWTSAWCRERAQHVHLRALDLELDLAPGEQIRTEISAKYDRERTIALLRAGGFELVEWITDDDEPFGLALARPID